MAHDMSPKARKQHSASCKIILGERLSTGQTAAEALRYIRAMGKDIGRGFTYVRGGDHRDFRQKLREFAYYLGQYAGSSHSRDIETIANAGWCVRAGYSHGQARSPKRRDDGEGSSRASWRDPRESSDYGMGGVAKIRARRRRAAKARRKATKRNRR